MAFEDYYLMNPISILDQNTWDERLSFVETQFLRMPTVYTPLITWDNHSQQTGAATTKHTELIVGDPDVDPIGMSDLYVEQAIGIDSRERSMGINRYASKVQYQKGEDKFNQWFMSPANNRDWSGVLSGLLGANIVEVFELLSRNAFLKQPAAYRTFGGSATDFSGLNADAKFGLNIVNEWNLRLGSIGSPIIPDETGSAKLAIVPPGSIYDFQTALASASGSEDKFWIDQKLYSGEKLRNEIGSWRDVRFVQVPNNKYGMNNAVLYNAGPIAIQCEVSAAINRQDGAPDPETTKVDDVWATGQKTATHYVQLAAASFIAGDFALGDLVSIHTQKTTEWGITDGVDFLAGDTIVRRVVAIDVTNQRLTFDRPVMRDYLTDLGTSVFAYVTKATHVGMCLVLGSPEGVRGSVNQPVALYEPKPVDDFDRVWRFVWDAIVGTNIWEPSTFEVHFVAVSVPKAGGIILPPAA